MRNTGFWILQVLPFALLLGLVVLRIVDPPQLTALRHTVFDTYQKLMPRPVPSDGPAVVVIEIDEKAFRQLGAWPWPRTRLAQIFQKLDAAGVRAAATLFDLSEPDPNAPQRLLLRLPPLPELDAIKPRFAGWASQDKALAQAIARRPTVTGFRMTVLPESNPPARKAAMDVAAGAGEGIIDYPGAAAPIKLLEAAAAGNGALTPTLPTGTTTRRLPLFYRIGGNVYPTVLAELIRLTRKAKRIVLAPPRNSGLILGSDRNLGLARIDKMTIPVDGRGWFWLHVAPTDPSRRISAADLLTDQVDAKRLRGRIALVALRTAASTDWLTPLGSRLSGPLLEAQALEQLLQGRFLSRPGFADDLEVAYIILVALLLMLVLSRARGYAALAAVVGAVLLVPLAGWAAFVRFGWLIDGMTPALILIAISLATYAAFVARRQTSRDTLMLRFQRHLPPRLLNRVIRSENRAPPDQSQRPVTAINLQIREFDSLVERFGAREMTALQRRLYSPATAILFNHGGTLDKVAPGRLTAFWNAPAEQPDHVARACQSALEIMSASAKLNERLRGEGRDKARPPDMEIGIGIETGDCFVGDTGSAQRFEYSAVGPAVSVAAVIAAQSRFFGANIVLGPTAHEAVPDLATLELDLLRRPSGPPLRLFALLGGADLASDAAFERLLTTHKDMLVHYRARRWNDAQDAMAEAREIADGRLDTLYDLYSARIRAFRSAPPPDNWDGSSPGSDAY